MSIVKRVLAIKPSDIIENVILDINDKKDITDINDSKDIKDSNDKKDSNDSKDIKDLNDKKNKKDKKDKKDINDLKEIKAIIPSNLQTKKWRKDQDWYKDGKRTECEKYQINQLMNIFESKAIQKTNLRINIYTNETIEISNHKFSKLENKFQFSENFDGKIELNDKTIYFNLKMITDQGGSQTRSMKEVFHFITAQEKWIKTQNNTYIMNILDGEYSFQNVKYLPDTSESPNIFTGDMFQFHNYFQETFLK